MPTPQTQACVIYWHTLLPAVRILSALLTPWIAHRTLLLAGKTLKYLAAKKRSYLNWMLTDEAVSGLTNTTFKLHTSAAICW